MRLVVLTAAVLTGCASPPAGRTTAANTLAAPSSTERGERAPGAGAWQQAETLYQQERWSDARAAFARLTQAHPRHALLWLRLGNCHARLDEPGAAADAYEQALRAEPGHARAAYNLGLIRLAQAEAAFLQAQRRPAALGELRDDAQRLHRVARWLLDHDGAAPTAAPR